MGEIEDLMNKLVNDSTQIIVNPDTFDRMVKQNLPISYAEPMPAEKYIENLFNTRKAEALEIIKRLPPRSNFLLPSVNALYDEIVECILFGLNGAAITLCSILVEFVLKQATYYYENKCKFTYNSKLWDEFEKITLDPAIDRARKANIINHDFATRLKAFKSDIRNPYNHYNTKKITEGVVAQNVKVVNIKTQEVKTQDLDAKDNPMIHAQAKRHVDKVSVVFVFAFSDNVVKHLLGQIEKKT